MVKKSLVVCSVLGSLMVVGLERSAHAQNVRAAEPASLAEAIKELGYRAALEKDDSGDPLIRSAADGGEFIVYFYGCEKGKDCEWVDFHKIYALKKENYVKFQSLSEEWNKNLNFATVYISDDTIGISYKLLLKSDGMSKDLFKANFATWILSYSDFRKKLYESIKKD